VIPTSNSKAPKESPVSQPVKNPSPSTNAQPREKKGAMAWLRSLFEKITELVRETARKIADVAKRSPLMIAAAAAIAMLFLA
jgi:hypothetical protein